MKWVVVTDSKEMLMLPGEEHAIAIVESFGYGWYANACPPHADGQSSAVPGWVRGGNFGEKIESARAWCERICGIHSLKPNDIR